MRQYTTFFPEKITNLVPIVIISSIFFAFYTMDIWLDGNITHPIAVIFGLILLGMVLTSAYFLCRAMNHCEIIRYDAQQQQFLRCTWQPMRWQVSQYYLISQFVGVAAEEVYYAGEAQYGRVFLLGHNGAEILQIDRIAPNKGSLHEVATLQKKVAKISQLPVLSINIVDTPRQIIRDANPTRFQAALPPNTPLGVIIGRVIWAAICLAISWHMAQFFANKEPLLSTVAWSIASFLCLYALSGSLKTWKMWRNRMQYLRAIRQTHNIPNTPSRNESAQRHSGEFVLFSRAKYIFWSVLILAISGTIISKISFDDGFNILLPLSMAVVLLSVIFMLWQTAFSSRKLVYHAQTDVLTLYQLNKILMWQPENDYSARNFIGVACEQSELWLIGASNGVDICMGKASGLSQNADERARQIAEM
ncbi:hypothetical protein MIS45_11275 [Wielerella bovis]|uniref:hypothetical protein n=1 Tax=Wielerella bovis TaxID=2917790 RepID=UPI0020193D20|nr:hypothetical protein [Wielerella bovis]ULJ69301.1 hypothetical protein MIS45_11275 [Wielerella bovis]